MGYELNSKAYHCLMTIEVSIREFFISLIKKEGVHNWITSFFGTNQKAAIDEFVRSIHEKVSKKEELTIEGTYIYKLTRAKKTIANSEVKIYHPFYYLNWTDMEALFQLKSNYSLLDPYINKDNRNLLGSLLSSLNEFRNDIAHSRFITENDYSFIDATLKQISVIIPNFTEHTVHQSMEDSLPVIRKNILIQIKKLQSDKTLSDIEIQEALLIFEKSINSFWLNSFCYDLVQHAKSFKNEIDKYKNYRSRPGGLLDLIEWRKNNTPLMNQLINLL